MANDEPTQRELMDLPRVAGQELKLHWDAYPARPGSGPEGKTCADCRNMVHKRMGKVYRKCFLAMAWWSASERTDIHATAPACRHFSPPDSD